MVMDRHLDAILPGEGFNIIPQCHRRLTGDIVHLHLLGKTEELVPVLLVPRRVDATSYYLDTLALGYGLQFLLYISTQIRAELGIAPFAS